MQMVSELAYEDGAGIQIGKVVDGIKWSIIETAQLGWEVIDRAG